jgi:hypothetical protein
MPRSKTTGYIMQNAAADTSIHAVACNERGALAETGADEVFVADNALGPPPGR